MLPCDILERAASISALTAAQKSSRGMILELISYGSVLMPSISIISVMECPACPLALMAAWVMDPHCIAAKSWLNNLPPLWLERLSQLFNDVSMLEGRGTHRFTHTLTLTRARLTDLDPLSWGQADEDAHERAANETRPSSVEQLKWLHRKETPTRHCQNKRDCMQHADV